MFTFELYDNDQSGVIESKEVTQMLYDIYGSNFANNKHARRYESYFVFHNMYMLQY